MNTLFARLWSLEVGIRQLDWSAGIPSPITAANARGFPVGCNSSTNNPRLVIWTKISLFDFKIRSYWMGMPSVQNEQEMQSTSSISQYPRYEQSFLSNHIFPFTLSPSAWRLRYDVEYTPMYTRSEYKACMFDTYPIRLKIDLSCSASLLNDQ